MTITTDADQLFRRLTRAIPVLRDVQADLDELEREAIAGNSTERTGPRPVDDEPEPPTHHHDPTGDAAITGAVAAIRKRRTRITDALHDITRAFDHLELVVRACQSSPTEPPREPTPVELCAGKILMTDHTERQCNRLREPGDELCAECKLHRDTEHRKMAAPECSVIHCTEPVEQYQTTKGVAYRGMIYTDGTWQARGDVEPMCGQHRRAAERNAS